MGGKKRAAPEQKATKQTTLGDAFAKKAKAEDEAPPPPCFEQIEFSHRTVKEKLFSTARTLYDKYCQRSPLMKGATDAESSAVQHKPANKRATRSRTSLEADADSEEESLNVPYDPSWEQDGLQFVTMLEPLVSPVHGLQRYLQEFLIHIVLNHERHNTDLSVRALRLLMRNAKCHPPCSIPEDSTPGRLRVNKELWVPSDKFKFTGSKCPLILASRPQLEIYLDLWKHAHEFSSKAVKGVSFGQILLLQYYTHLIHLDLDVRLRLVESTQCRGYQKSEQVMNDSVLWQTLCTGMGSASVHQMWLGSTRNSVALLQSLVITFLRSKQGPEQQQQQARTNRRSSQTPQRQGLVAGTPQGAASSAARLSSTPMGALTPGVAGAQQLNKAPLSVHELGAMASKTLRLWQQMYAVADSSSGKVVDRSVKGTDLFYLSEELHRMLTGHARNQDNDPLARTINALVKEHDQKLALLSAFTHEARLTLLSMQFLDMAQNAWTSYAQPSGGAGSGAMAREGVGACQLPSGLSMLKDYLERKGLDRSGQAQIDPLQVLACLAPLEARQAAAAAVPHLADALKGGVSDLYTQAKKSLMKVDTFMYHSKDCTGFTLWLCAFVRAAAELQHMRQVQPAEAGALRTLVMSLKNRMDEDSDSSFAETLLAQCAKAAMLKAT